MSDEGRGDRRPLVERLRPTRLRDLVGNSRPLAQLEAWAESWEDRKGPPARRAVLLEGPPGVGKTTAALALAAERGWTVVEMNASDARNETAIEEVAGRAALTNTLGSFGVYRGTRGGGRTLILLDEADSLTGRPSDERPRARSRVTFREFVRARYGSLESLAAAWGLGRPGSPPGFESWESVPATGGRGAWTRLAPAQRDLADWKAGESTRDSTDRGGLGAIARLVRETRQPLALTVNDPTTLHRYSPVFRSGVLSVRLDPIAPTELKSLLRRVAVAEGFTLSGATVDRIVARCHGDLRAALNDLEAISPLPPGTDLDPLLGGRDSQREIADLTGEVLSHPRFYPSWEISNRVDATPEETFPWFEEAVARSRFAMPAARAAAIDHLATGDRFLAWARRQRVYSLWSYATESFTGGASLALAGPSGASGVGDPYVGFPEFLRAMGRTKALRGLRQALLDKVGERLHQSRRKTWDNGLPFLDLVFRPAAGREGPRVADLRRRLARELELNAEEVGFLMGREPESPHVEKVLRKDSPPVPSLPPVSEPKPDEPAPARPKKVQRRLGEF